MQFRVLGSLLDFIDVENGIRSVVTNLGRFCIDPRFPHQTIAQFRVAGVQAEHQQLAAIRNDVAA